MVTHKPTSLHLRYIKDSLQPRPPYKRPLIQIIEKPLRPGILGITKQITEQEYLIQITPNQTRLQWDITLLHELVHVKQFIRRQLYLEANKWHWQKKPIDWKQPYLEREWEKAAFIESIKYWHQTK